MEERLRARLLLVREHVRGENNHDLDAIMRTFGANADYDDEAWKEHHAGHDGVRRYYADLMGSLPDLCIDVQREHVTSEHVILEVIIRGTHLGTWRGLPPTGRTVAVPLCGVFSFDANDRLASERIYYDRATALRQLGVFFEPDTVVGRVMTTLTHPATVARVAANWLTATLRVKRRSSGV